MNEVNRSELVEYMRTITVTPPATLPGATLRRLLLILLALLPVAALLLWGGAAAAAHVQERAWAVESDAAAQAVLGRLRGTAYFLQTPGEDEFWNITKAYTDGGYQGINARLTARTRYLLGAGMTVTLAHSLTQLAVLGLLMVYLRHTTHPVDRLARFLRLAGAALLTEAVVQAVLREPLELVNGYVINGLFIAVLFSYLRGWGWLVPLALARAALQRPLFAADTGWHLWGLLHQGAIGLWETEFLATIAPALATLGVVQLLVSTFPPYRPPEVVPMTKH